jgi:aspartyl/asparaginyl beta-hydroxylase (cupin superfamily)
MIALVARMTEPYRICLFLTIERGPNSVILVDFSRFQREKGRLLKKVKKSKKNRRKNGYLALFAV